MKKRQQKEEGWRVEAWAGKASRREPPRAVPGARGASVFQGALKRDQASLVTSKRLTPQRGRQQGGEREMSLQVGHGQGS